jgi:hypothetical protein
VRIRPPPVEAPATRRRPALAPQIRHLTPLAREEDSERPLNKPDQRVTGRLAATRTAPLPHPSESGSKRDE